MTKSKTQSTNELGKTIQACIANGERILAETYDLEFRNPSSTRFFLVMIAQEEFAKALILFLVSEGIIPFSPPVRRAINDHVCKQLVGMIMDYVIMHYDDIEQLKAMISADVDLGNKLPSEVGSAMELLRYEKIERWERNNWAWAEDPRYDASALRVAEGKKDRRKQDALYVRIGRDGRVCSTPHAISEDETRSELERADRYKLFVNSLLSKGDQSYRYDKAMNALKVLFATR